jgi:hypothetical protein
MPSAPEYRAKAAEFARLAGKAVSAREHLIYRQRARAFTSLADDEEWAQAHRDKPVSERAAADGDSRQGIAEEPAPPPSRHRQ